MDSLASNGQGRRWPLALIFIAIFISFVYLPLEYLFPSIYFNSEFDYFEIFTILTYLAPLAYIIGVVYIHLDTVAGKPERVRLFALGGITLLIGGISGTMSYGFYFYNMLSSNAQTSWDLLYTIIFLLPLAGIIGSFFGGYYALKRKSLTWAIFPGSLSVLIAPFIWPLALIAIGLGKDDLEKTDSTMNEGRHKRHLIGFFTGRKRNLKVFTVLIAIVIVITLLLMAFIPSILNEGSGSNLPIHDSDYIMWSVNWTRNGNDVFGVSIGTFTNVSTIASAQALLTGQDLIWKSEACSMGRITFFSQLETSRKTISGGWP